MRQVQWVVIVGVVLLSVGRLFASDDDEGEVSEKSLYRALTPNRHQLHIGAVAANLHYSEIFDIPQVLSDFKLQRIEGTPKSDEYGIHYGGRVWYRSVDRRGRLWINPSLSFIYTPRATYDGSYTDSIADANGRVIGQRYFPLKGTKANFFLDGEIVGGRLWQLAGRQTAGGPSRLYLWAGSGVDWRLWGRYLGGETAEYYSWLNLPISLRLSKHFNQIDALELQLTGLIMLWGQMQIVNPACNLVAPAVGLGPHPALEVRFNWSRQLTERTGVFLGSFFEYYHFGRSELANSDSDCDGPGIFFEPASTTFWFGLELAATWNW